MRGYRRAVARTLLSGLVAGLAAGILTACSSPSASPQVPSLGSVGSANPAGGTGSGRVAALHAAAKCIREHGAPTYQDPVLTADGQVFSDSRSLENIPGSKDRGGDPLEAIRQACGSLIAAAGLRPEDEPPAPAKLVEAGVKAAQCERAHGMPNVKDPTSATPYTPGHGFHLTLDQLPAGGKLSPGFDQARQACHALMDEETRQSTLGNLSRG